MSGNNQDDIQNADIPRPRPPPPRRGVRPTKSSELVNLLEAGIGQTSVGTRHGSSTPPRVPIRRPPPAHRGIGASKSFDSTASEESISLRDESHSAVTPPRRQRQRRPPPARRGVGVTRSFEGINALEIGASGSSTTSPVRRINRANSPHKGFSLEMGNSSLRSMGSFDGDESSAVALKSESTSARKTMPVRRVSRTYSSDKPFNMEMGNSSITSVNSSDGIGMKMTPSKYLGSPHLVRPSRRRGKGQHGYLYGKVLNFCGRCELALQRRGMSILMLLVSLALCVCIFVTVKIYYILEAHLSSTKEHSQQQTIILPEPSYNLLFSNLGASNFHSFFEPEALDHHHQQKAKEPSFGGLDFDFLIEDGAQRNIIRDFELEMTDFRDLITKERDDDQDMYYAFDDDIERGSDMLSSSEKSVLPKNKMCRRVQEHRLSFPTCNSLHEQALLDSHVRYLSYGGYREVFKIDHEYADESEKIIIKELRYDHDETTDMFEFIRMDAVVAERLTASPLTFDLYGFCGLTVVSEFFQYGDIEADVLYNGEGVLADGETLDDSEHVDPKNGFTPIQKLEISLQMADSLAALHNFEGGVIVHDDVQLSQFLYTSNDKTHIKLNDFNRAEFMLWDDEKEEYCRYQNGKGHGSWRSPEEYVDGALNEKIDVWSLGNNMYSLLTGLVPFHDVKSDSKMRKLLINHKTAFIDPRYRESSLAEKTLVDLIEQCWRFDPDDRPSTHEIAVVLRESIKQIMRQA